MTSQSTTMSDDGNDEFKNFSKQSSILSRTVIAACLEVILSDQHDCAKVYKIGKILWNVSAELRKGTVPLADLQITKTLRKHPEDYREVDGLDHVTVALRMNENGKLPKKFRKDDEVSYLYCTDGQPHHLSEMDKEDGVKGLKVDVDYYLTQVLHPAVSAICEPIRGLEFDAAIVADALGLDSAPYENLSSFQD